MLVKRVLLHVSNPLSIEIRLEERLRREDRDTKVIPSNPMCPSSVIQMREKSSDKAFSIEIVK